MSANAFDLHPVMGSDSHGCPTVNYEAARAEYIRAMGTNADTWVVGGMGSEVPFLFNGRWTLYVWNPRTGQHGYLDLATDVVDESR